MTECEGMEKESQNSILVCTEHVESHDCHKGEEQ